jgi:hypothetical protein
MEYRRLNFPVMIPSIERIDYENKIVYHQDVEEGQPVVNFVRMFHKQSPWELLINHSKTDSERLLVERWRGEFLYPQVQKHFIQTSLEKYKGSLPG